MRGSGTGKASRKRWTLTWALLLSVYMAIGLPPTASAAENCTGPTAGAFSIDFDGSATVAARVATTSGADVNFCGNWYQDVNAGLTIAGSTGADTLTITAAGAAYWALLGGISIDLLGGDDVVILNGTSGIDTINAASFATFNGVEELQINGNGDADALTGLNGADNTFDGGAGIDAMNGGDGDDVFLEDSDDLSADVINGGTGEDTVNYSGGTRTAGIVVDLDDSTAPGPTAPTVSEDDLTGVEDVVGTGYADFIYGNALANLLTGGGGDDTFSGGNGIDEMYGNGGDDAFLEGWDNLAEDLIDGGASSDGDVVDYSGGTRSAGVVVDLDTSAAPDPIAPAVSEDGITAVEDVVGTAFSDRIFGDVEDNVLQGGAGDDVLKGGDGSDEINGDGGKDNIEGGAGTLDTLDGGAQVDTLSYAADASGVTVDLNGPSATDGDATGDLFANFENLTGGAGPDVLSGDGTANVIDGGAGNDTIEGLVGADRLIGGAGTDTVSYANSAVGVRAVINGGAKANTIGDALGDVLQGFENMTGSGWNDILSGDAAANSIYGGTGDDSIKGGGGSDNLYGGVGIDTLDGERGNDNVFGGDDDDVLRYSGGGADSLNGDSNTDQCQGYATQTAKLYKSNVYTNCESDLL